MYKKTIIFILIFTILFNFITIPKKTHAEAITMSYGLYVFLQAAYAAGLTYIVADRVTEDGIKLYQEWQKFNENKPEKPDDNDMKNGLANLLGIGLIDKFSDLVDNVKGFFNSLDSKSGENLLPQPNYYETNDNLLSVDEGFLLSPGESLTFNLNGNMIAVVARQSEGYPDYVEFDLVSSTGTIKTIFGHRVKYRNVSWNVEIDSLSLSFNPNIISIQLKLSSSKFQTFTFPTISDGTLYEDVSGFNKVIYNIDDSSYILTNNRKDIKDNYPNIDILPQEKFETIVTPEGYYEKYIGDDLVDDYIQSIPKSNPSDLNKSTPGSFVDTDQGMLWIPKGQPIPNPNTNPDPDPDPTGDTGSILTFLKRIFVTDPINPLDFTPLMNIGIEEKFPFSLPWDVKRSFDVLVRPPKPIKFTVPMVTEEITIDLEEFNSWALITRTFLSIIFILILIVVTRRFIGGA